MPVALGYIAATTLGGIVAGTAIGDMMGAVAPAPGPVVAATSAAAKPSNTKTKTTPEAAGLQDAKSSLWLSAFLIVAAVAILGFGGKALTNVRIA